MSATYKVWIHVEQYDESGGATESQDVDLPFASVAEFDTEAEAIDFAVQLQQIGANL